MEIDSAFATFLRRSGHVYKPCNTRVRVVKCSQVLTSSADIRVHDCRYIERLKKAQAEGILDFQDNTGKKEARKMDFLFHADGDAATAEASVRHMPIFPSDHLGALIEERLSGDRKKEQKKNMERSTLNSKKKGGAAAPPPLLPRVTSAQRVKSVARKMADRRKGSYILCKLHTAELHERMDDEPVIRIDAQEQAVAYEHDRTLDSRIGLYRLSRQFNYQFNSLRCGRYSTMMLLHYFRGAHGGRLPTCTSQLAPSRTWRG